MAKMKSRQYFLQNETRTKFLPIKFTEICLFEVEVLKNSIFRKSSLKKINQKCIQTLLPILHLQKWTYFMKNMYKYDEKYKIEYESESQLIFASQKMLDCSC